ncbi:MAG: PilZ domain-containing protein [Candidatus Omnitrophica bacterium]|nr:PilZ domain-containing protein [Candidatus Omnitrophota bacterium]
MGETMDNERRRLPRWGVRRPAMVRLNEEWYFNNCYVDDMNLKGMRIILSQALSQEQAAKMAISFGEMSFEVEVLVPWVKESQGRYIHGVTFSRIKDADKDRIYQYIFNNCFDQLKDQWWPKKEGAQ